MAARIRKPFHDNRTREKIRTSQLLNRLHAYALSEADPQSGKTVELTSTHVKAIEVLLRKSLPDLTQVEGTMTNINVDASELTDAQLAAIIAGGDAEESSDGVDEPAEGAEGTDCVH